MILAFDLLLTSPLVTFEPAIFPALDTLKIFCISAVPRIVSFISGSRRPESDFSI